MQSELLFSRIQMLGLFEQTCSIQNDFTIEGIAILFRHFEITPLSAFLICLIFLHFFNCLLMVFFWYSVLVSRDYS